MHKILEIGCGTGRNLPHLLKTNAQVHAVDFDFDAVSTARSFLDGKGFFAVALGEQLPFHNDVFHEVHCIDVLHWSPSQEQFESLWREAWRVMHPDGSFFARTRCAKSKTVSTSGASTWFLPDLLLLQKLAADTGADGFKPLLINVVAEEHAEVTLILRKKV